MSPLSPEDYERMRRATRTHREDLVVRLCAEVGLRPAEVAAVEPGDVSTVDGTHVVAVADRATVLPADLEHDLRKYAASEGVADDERVVPVSARRVQMLVRDVADRTATETGDDRFRDVSSRALREHFVVSHLRAGVDPRIVAAAAGFDSVAGLAPYLGDPSTVEVAAALGDGPAAGDGETPEPVRNAAALLATVADGLGGHETAASLFDAVVERAATVDGYRYAWIAERTGDATGPGSETTDATESGDETADATVVAHAGIDAAVVEAELETSDFDGTRRAGVDDQRVAAFAAGGGVVSLPVGAFDGVEYALGLGVETTPDSEDAVADLHDGLSVLVERATRAVRRRRRLVADVVTELRFDVHDPDAVLVGLATDLDATVSVSGVVPGDPGLVLYAEVADATPQAVVDAVGDDDRVERVRYVDDGDDGPVFELVVTESPARTLVDLDARIRAIRADAESVSVTAVVPADADVRALRDAVRDDWPAAALAGQETVERTVERDASFQGRLREALTDRQLAVLQSAYHGGYFQWPRESTGEELADSLDVAAPTLHNHLRVAQRKLLDAFFES
ncbi:tyrosine-type recombinase/integrase [Halorubellus sp. JP-L1]|uniref:bacterio-opsin activator domain-containing protein n=1 Tax=Halorubellus sp. JP-L1 TaxID=2715753 RepID=UPI00140B25D9|nr:tyrosine-type recombinase/integrase [Halorubellus sp. JP-L1]